MSTKLHEKIEDLARLIVLNPSAWTDGIYEFEDIDADVSVTYEDNNTTLKLLVNEKATGKSACVYLKDNLINIENVIRALSILERTEDHV